MKKWRVWLVVAVVFLSGALAGSVATGVYMQHRMGSILHGGPPAARQVIMKKLTAELNLTRDQQAKVGEVVEETQFKLMQLRARYHPQMEEIINTGVANMKPLLSPDQRKKLDSFYGEMKGHWRMRSMHREGMFHGRGRPGREQMR